MSLQKIGIEHGASGLEMGSSIGGLNLGMADAKVMILRSAQNIMLW